MASKRQKPRGFDLPERERGLSTHIYVNAHIDVNTFNPEMKHLQSLSKVLGQIPQIHISYPKVIPPRPLFNVGLF